MTLQNTQIVKTEDIAKGSVTEEKIAGQGVGKNIQRVAIGVYDFAVSGGVIGDISLGVSIPSKAIVTRVLYDVLTAVVGGGGATIGIKMNAGGDLLAPAVLGTNGTAGLHDGIPVNTATSSVKATADRVIYLSIAAADLTAGRLRAYLEYVQSE